MKKFFNLVSKLDKVVDFIHKLVNIIKFLIELWNSFNYYKSDTLNHEY